MFYPPVGLMFVRAPAPACGMAPLEVCFKTAVKEEMAQLGAAGRCNGALGHHRAISLTGLDNPEKQKRTSVTFV